MTIQDEVKTAADLLERAEKNIRQAQNNLMRLSKSIEAVHKLGTLGYLESSQYGAHAKALAGKLAGVEADLFSFHQHLTNKAQELNVDLPQPKSGGKR